MRGMREPVNFFKKVKHQTTPQAGPWTVGTTSRRTSRNERVRSTSGSAELAAERTSTIGRLA